MKKNKILDENVFFEVIGVLNRTKVIWWLDHGTLLGYVRDGQPIEWDRDFDIGTSAEINEMIETVFPEIKKKYSNAYIDSMANALKIQFFDRGGDSWSIDIASYQFKNGKAIKYWPNLMNASYVKKILAIVISTFCGRKPNKSDKFSVKVISLLTRPLSLLAAVIMNAKKRHKIISKLSRKLPYTKNSINSEFLDGIKKIKIKCVEINIPCKYEEYLAQRYGDNWKIPQRNWNYLTDDGGVN
jgi:LicD family